MVVLMGAVMFYAIPPVMAQGSGNVSLAPLNPAFLEYLQKLQHLKASNLTAGEHALGYIPSPLDLSHLKGIHVFPEQLGVASPSSYDLRTLGKVTPVKDQGNCGDCWAFATYGSLESSLLPGETDDFSENNLKNTNGFDYGYCSGGNGIMSMAYLARWSGPVYEADDPYNASSGTSPSGLSPRKHVQDVYIIPVRTSSTDNDNLKTAVMTYGAVMVSMFASSSMSTSTTDSYWNNTTHAYYYNGAGSHNHAVVIVGWDDSYSNANFSTAPPANGAFIVRNSWGSSWGDAGYFYVSYYDTVFALQEQSYCFLDAEPITNFSRVYQYDPLGWTTSVGYSGVNYAWFANIFTASASEPLNAVSFYAASPSSPYEIYIYTNAASGPRSGTLAGATTGTIASPGYHTIVLNAPVPLTSGQKFSVVVKLTTPVYNYPVSVEQPLSGYSSQATANTGQSYVSANGSSWADITTSYPNTNVCLKAFTAGSIYSSSIGSRNSIKITDMSGTLPTPGAAITVAAWDASGKALALSASATPPTLLNYGTVTINGTNLTTWFTNGIPMTYSFTVDSSKYIITNVKSSTDGTLNVPNGYTSGTTNFVANSVGPRNSIKITDMSGSLPTSGAAITVAAWDVSGKALTQSASATPPTLLNYRTVTINGTDLAAWFIGGTPISYSFTVPSSKYIITNVKSSTDGSINIPYSYPSGTTNFVANSIGPRNTIMISDVSGSLSTSGAAITIAAWDANGNALTQSGTAVPLTLYNHGTTPIAGTDLTARFSGTPMSYSFAVASPQYIITNVKSSTDGTINIPYVYTSGTTTYESNDINSHSTIKITDASGSLSSSGASITVAAWDASGKALTLSASATPPLLLNYGTATIKGSDLTAWFTGGTPVLYEFTIGSSMYLVTNVTSNTESTVTIPSVYSSGVAGGI